MRYHSALSAPILRALNGRKPFLWINENWLPVHQARSTLRFQPQDVYRAEQRLNRFATVLAKLFPELEATRGIIESPLHSAENLQRATVGPEHSWGRWLIKADHSLPVAGSIKARGGIYEVLVHAESLALRERVMRPEDDRLALASPAVRTIFARHQVAVGSTGNLGLSIGIMAAALGFQAVVHMSSDAKQWKKTRLSARGVQVIEHQGDYGAAVASGRAQARANPDAYFIDDEHSEHLFLGYSVAAVRLKEQLVNEGVAVNAEHPLFVYLPCGVGGAPGGITFGLRALLGDHVHCFFAEPVASPCMLVRLAARHDGPISVTEIGLDNRTEADGLAVGQASELVASMMKPLVSGVFTVEDGDLFEDLYLLEQSEGLRVEPSATAGFRGPRWLLKSQAGQEYLAKHDLTHRLREATHLLWTTGGALVPEVEYSGFHERGRAVHMQRLSASGV